MMKSAVVTAILCFVFSSAALGLEAPDICGLVMIDYLNMSQDSSYNRTGMFVASPDRFRVRRAILELSGSAGELIDYKTAFGLSICRGAGVNLTLKEAVIKLSPFRGERIALGIGTIHVRRGFNLAAECSELLTVERSRFSRVVTTLCHPVGVQLDAGVSLGSAGDIEAQVSLANGPNASLDEEHDANFALFYRLPVDGLAVGGFYTALAMEMNWEHDGTENASRYGLGLDYASGGLSLRAEMINVKGVLPGMRPRGVTEPGENVHNVCKLAQASYLIEVGLEVIPAIIPYINYQSWDRWSNADTGDYRFSWITGGAKIYIGSPRTYLHLDYRAPLTTPEHLSEDASIFTARLALSF